MSIKSDRWIREECQTERWAVMCNGKFDRWVHRDQLKEDGTPNHFLRTEFSDASNLYHVKKIAQSPLISPYFPRTTEVEIEPQEIEYRRAHYRNGQFFCWQDELAGKRKEIGMEGKALHPPEWSVHDKAVGNKTRKVIPFGVSSYGYDIRCGTEFKIFTNINSTHIDPKNFDENNFVTKFVPHGEPCIIPPNSFALANTLEVFDIRRNTLVICIGKSTYARCGIVVNVTPLEPEWKGSLTLEFSNTTPLPAYIYAGEGCAQVLFLESDEECEISYADRNGKYQDQIGAPVPPKM